MSASIGGFSFGDEKRRERDEQKERGIGAESNRDEWSDTELQIQTVLKLNSGHNYSDFASFVIGRIPQLLSSIAVLMEEAEEKEKEKDVKNQDKGHAPYHYELACLLLGLEKCVLIAEELRQLLPKNEWLLSINAVHFSPAALMILRDQQEGIICRALSLMSNKI